MESALISARPALSSQRVAARDPPPWPLLSHVNAVVLLHRVWHRHILHEVRRHRVHKVPSTWIVQQRLRVTGLQTLRQLAKPPH